MKILEYTLGLPPYRRGGLPEYSTDLSKELARNNDVTLMYPGSRAGIRSTTLKFHRQKSNKYNFKIIEMQNPLPVSLGLGISKPAIFMKKYSKQNIKDFLIKENFDIIHLHTIMGLPKEFVEIAHQLKIKIVYTTHDFYGFCPKYLSTNAVKELEITSCSPDCMICPNGPSPIKMLIMQSHFYKNIKNTSFIKGLRKYSKKRIRESNIVNANKKISEKQAIKKLKLLNYYAEILNKVDLFHFNSTVSRDYVKKFLPQINGKVVNISLTSIKDERNKKSENLGKSTLNISYIGPYDTKKGFFVFESVAKRLRSQYKNFKILCCGDNVNYDFFNNSWVTNYSILQKKEMDKFYQKSDIIVMPSLWHETFGFVALEAISKGIPCLVSKKVGAKDLLPFNFVFNDENDLFIKLKMILKDNDLWLKYKKEVDSSRLPINFKEHVDELFCEIYLK